MKTILRASPSAFALILIILSAINYDFLIALGWDPISAPTFDWPSGLALAPKGYIMTAAFLVGGVYFYYFSAAIRTQLKPSVSKNIGTFMLVSAGVAFSGLAFTTDPTIRETPITWHGRLHDLSFVLLGISLFFALIFLMIAFFRDSTWRWHGVYSLIAITIAIPSFALKGFAFYVFLILIISWATTVAMRATTDKNAPNS